MGKLSFRGSRVTIGRGTECQLALTDSRISRQHAVLRRSGTAWEVEVLAQATYEGLVLKNGEPVPRGTRARIEAGDELVFGQSPAYRVAEAGPALVLEYSDMTQRRHGEAPAPRLAFARDARVPEQLLTVTVPQPMNLEDLRADAVDVVVVTEAPPAPKVRAAVDRLRAERFFLTIVFVATPAPRPDLSGVAVIGDAYVWGVPADPDLGETVLSAVAANRARETSLSPYRTAEVLYLDARGRVYAQDWVKGGMRELPLSELQHQILFVMADAQRASPGAPLGLGVADISERVAGRGWARSEHTIANELSARLPRAVRAAGLHPHLFVALGTREKSYGLSTPPSCLKELTVVTGA